MHFLFITEKYCREKKYGLTNNMVNLIGSYECADIGTYKHIFISQDDGDIWTDDMSRRTKVIDDVLLKEEYDYAYVSPYASYIVSSEVATKLGRKILINWTDTVTPNFQSSYRKYLHKYTSNNNIVWDYGNGEEIENFLCVATPQDTRIFYPTEEKNKNIDFSFLGMRSFPLSDHPGVIYRKNLFEKLKIAGIPIYISGGRGDNNDNLTPNEYSDIMRRSKVSLNPNWGHWSPHRKGRMYETAASGSFILCSYPEVFYGKDGWYFDPNSHFGHFNDENFIDSVYFWLNNNKERQQRTEAAYNHWFKYYS